MRFPRSRNSVRIGWQNKSNNNCANLGLEAQLRTVAWSRLTTNSSPLASSFSSTSPTCSRRSGRSCSRRSISPKTYSGPGRGSVVTVPGQGQAADHRQGRRRYRADDRSWSPESDVRDIRLERLTAARMSSADLDHLKGLGSSSCCSMKARMQASSWRVEVCTPLRGCLRVNSANQRSI